MLLERGGCYNRGKDLNWKGFRDLGWVAAMGIICLLIYLVIYLSVIHTVQTLTVKRINGYMVQLSMEIHRSAVEHHLPYGITQILLSDTSERFLPYPQLDRPILELPTSEGSKAELTLMLVI